METCYSSHYWARCFEAMGYAVRLLPAQYVTPFVRVNKSNHNDAVAIGEASRRPNITAVPVKAVEQQDIQSLHCIRERHVSQRTEHVDFYRNTASLPLKDTKLSAACSEKPRSRVTHRYHH